MINETNRQATLSLEQVATYANDIVRMINQRKVTTVTPSQLRATVEGFCDDPTMTRSDINRIRIRVEQAIYN